MIPTQALTCGGVIRVMRFGLGSWPLLKSDPLAMKLGSNNSEGFYWGFFGIPKARVDVEHKLLQ
jgi:hypothetical protein